MQHARFVLFGLVAGLLAVGLSRFLDLSPVWMFGAGMVYGSFAQALAQRVLADSPAEMPLDPYSGMAATDQPEPPVHDVRRAQVG